MNVSVLLEFYNILEVLINLNKCSLRKWIFVSFPFLRSVLILCFYFQINLILTDVKEINVYLSARCTTPEGKGAYGYVIESELYNSHKKATYLKTTMPRMMMKAAIDAMNEAHLVD